MTHVKMEENNNLLQFNYQCYKYITLFDHRRALLQNELIIPNISPKYLRTNREILLEL